MKVHLVTDARLNPMRGELDGAIPIRPMEGVLIRLLVHTTDEVPDIGDHFEGSLALGFRPAFAKEFAHNLLGALQDLDEKDR